jgi:chromosome segregation ATPase
MAKPVFDYPMTLEECRAEIKSYLVLIKETKDLLQEYRRQLKKSTTKGKKFRNGKKSRQNREKLRLLIFGNEIYIEDLENEMLELQEKENDILKKHENLNLPPTTGKKEYKQLSDKHELYQSKYKNEQERLRHIVNIVQSFTRSLVLSRV